MPIEQTASGTTFTGGSIGAFRLLMLRSALQLEMKGIRVWQRHSAYTILKREFALKGNRTKVLAQVTEIIDQMSVEG